MKRNILLTLIPLHILISLTTIAITSCGKHDSTEAKYEQILDKRIEPDYLELKKALQAGGVNTANMGQVSVTFVADFLEKDPKNVHIARCFPQKKHIVISESEFKPLSPSAKKAVLAHEMGHCAFNWEGHCNRSIIMQEKVNPDLDAVSYRLGIYFFIKDLKRRGF